MNLFIRFYIGLTVDPRTTGWACDNTPQGIQDRKHSALKILSEHYDGFTQYDARGYWKGLWEPSLVVETIQDDDGPGWSVDDSTSVRKAREVASALARILNQACVGLAFAPVSFELVEPAQ